METRNITPTLKKIMVPKTKTKTISSTNKRKKHLILFYSFSFSEFGYIFIIASCSVNRLIAGITFVFDDQML